MRRLYRLLLDPTADAGGAPAAISATPPAATLNSTLIQVPATEFQRLMELPGRIAAMEAENASRLRAEQERATQALIQKGQAEEAVRTVRGQLEAERDQERATRATLEQRAKSYARDNALGQALSEQPLGDGSHEQLMTLWKSKFDAHADGDSFAVRTSTFQSPKDFVREQLAKPEFAKFLRPATQGGAGGGGAATNPNPTAQTPAAPTPPAANLGLHVAQQWALNSKQATAGDPRLNSTLPMIRGVKRA